MKLWKFALLGIASIFGICILGGLVTYSMLYFG